LTAEIAILNKTAVALASDSAVTISAGSDQQKIYDSGDKLFELSRFDSIGIMINSDMDFMEAPLPVLIKEYRRKSRSFKKVEDAATDFLKFLHKFGLSAPDRVKRERLRSSVVPLVQSIESRSQSGVMSRLAEMTEKNQTYHDFIRGLIAEQISVAKIILERAPSTDLIGGKTIPVSDSDEEYIRQLVAEFLPLGSPEQHAQIVDLIKANLHKRRLSSSTTGVVVAGFGSGELFPTLVSFELEGMLGGRLKFTQTNFVDIDRAGDKARVLPFAQREMVERFLYGLDESIERQITNFCKNSVPRIREEILASLDMTDEERNSLLQRAIEAEHAFFNGLAEDSFDAIRQQSRAEIEDMVEFMPKPEMATMAEALVNLTSIKRRVSRGMETVRGPIDVAVISKAEGFVWVKRKHYFPEELNYRFFDRMRDKIGRIRRRRNGEDMQPGNDGAREDRPKGA
jgi:hypothetical protein